MTGFCVVVAIVVVAVAIFVVTVAILVVVVAILVVVVTCVVAVAREVERRVVVKACLVVVVVFGANDVVSTPVSPLHKSVVQVQAKVISSMVTGSHEAEGRMGLSALPSSRESGLKHSLTVE